MKCKKAEKLFLRSLDGFLKPEENIKLEEHLKSCLICQTKREEYQNILDTLKKEDFPEPQPNFWERLQPKLKKEEKYNPWTLWKQWGMRAIPLSVLIIVLLAATIIFLIPPQQEELSQSEVLLLRNVVPFQETQTLLEEEGIEDKNMMLIFTAIEENNGLRRHFP